MTYQFKTTATMKPYNNKKWWIDSDIIRDINIEAESVEEALEQYRGKVHNNCYIDISKTALKKKVAMYQENANGESYQCGYVITAKTEFEDRDNYRWSTQYIDLWVNINIVVCPFVEV